MENNRRHPRIPAAIKLKIAHPDFGEKLVSTRNLSESGVFVLIEPSSLPPIGTTITGQVQDELDDRPVLQMKVVRVEEDGVGLEFQE